MATIEKFEIDFSLDIWKLAREICKNVEEIVSKYNFEK